MVPRVLLSRLQVAAIFAAALFLDPDGAFASEVLESRNDGAIVAFVQRVTQETEPRLRGPASPSRERMA